MVSWSLLDDELAMRAALREAASMSRDEFLSLYPTFGASSNYVVVYEGRHIDSKPLLAAAFSKQFPKLPKLTRHDLSGGKQTTDVLDRFKVPWVDLSRGDGIDSLWKMRIGEVTTKNDVAKLYGGSTQGGIAPSRTSPNIMLYTDPSTGVKNGYQHDGWTNDRTLHMYTGEGRIGPQALTNGNKSILEHRKNGRSLRLFSSHGYLEGTKTMLRQYLGEFCVDMETPYLIDESPDAEGNLRTVYVFRLRPVGPSLRVSGDLKSIYIPTKTQANGPRIVDLDVHRSESFDVPGVAPSVSQKREEKLVTAFKTALQKRGHECKAFLIPLPYNSKGIKTDIFDETDGVLYEAKASANRGDVRMALGQILDYARYLNGRYKRLAVLLPAEPASDMVDLLESHGIDVVWRMGESGKFIRVADGDRASF